MAAVRSLPILAAALVAVASPASGAAAQPGPGDRLGHGLAPLDHAGVLVLFGGFRSDGQPLGDTWTWTGAEWRAVAGPGPAPRRWPAMTYDRRRRRIVLHGGRDGVGPAGRSLDDTWTWDGSGWRLVSASGPGGRDHHRMVYDDRRGRVVLFGGWDGRSTRADTWELEGDTWRRVATEGPPARAAHGMSYDAARGSVVLFGGSSDTTFYADTWRWDGRVWSRIEAEGPPPRSFHGMGYDPVRRRVVVAGGRRGGHLYSDTWLFDGAGWARLGGQALPARYVYELAFDPGSAALVFHGGGFMREGRWTLFGETWRLSDSAWMRLP